MTQWLQTGWRCDACGVRDVIPVVDSTSCPHCGEYKLIRARVKLTTGQALDVAQAELQERIPSRYQELKER